MQYHLSENQDRLTVQLIGELTVSDEEQFRTLCGEVIAYNVTKCVVDLGRLSFLDSAGLGLMLVLKEMCAENGKTVTLRVGNSAVRDVLDISEFSSLIPYEDA